MLDEDAYSDVGQTVVFWFIQMSRQKTKVVSKWPYLVFTLEGLKKHVWPQKLHPDMCHT